MRLSRQVHYAICGVFDIAYNGGGEAVRVQTIGERQGIPVRYLEQIFQRLRKAKLVRSKRGPGGGYTLGRDASQLTLRHVVEAVEGPICPRAPRDSGMPRGGRDFRPEFLWPDLAEGFAGILQGVSLEDLCRRAARAAVTRADGDAYTYHI